MSREKIKGAPTSLSKKLVQYNNSLELAYKNSYISDEK